MDKKKTSPPDVSTTTDDAYDLVEEIYGDMCCSDANYEDRPYYGIIEVAQRCR